MSHPESKITCVSNLWLRQMHFAKAGDRNEGHTHSFDHVTLLAKGRVSVDVDGNVSEFSAPHMIYVQKGKEHYITALEDNTVCYCVHALRTGEREQDILDPDMIPQGIKDPSMLVSGIMPL